MKFVIQDTIPYAVEQVYEVQRERLSELAPYLSNIDSIIVKERRDEPGKVHFVNLWNARAGEIPTAIRAFVKPEMFRWTDHATWFLDDQSCDWRTVLGFFPEAIICHGHNTWRAKGSQTEVTINGEIVVHADKIGVPRLLAKSASEAVEKLVVRTIEPNLRKTNEGVTAFIRKQQGG
ncbi:MAG: hypothetical protein HQ461_05940 [Deltaproteobacteria bacterium]|jgi:hypothetical protein|nr:hypothetical protein [Deltaproteobacteria bacterium]